MPDNDVDQIANVIKDRSATFLITTSKNFTRLVAIDADLVSLKTIVVTDNEVMLTEDIKNRVSANVKQVRQQNMLSLTSRRLSLEDCLLL